MAARHFRDVLNAVEHERETFQVERHRRPVASIGQAKGASPPWVTWKDALALLQDGPRPDADFAADLDDLRRSVELLPADPWAHSSTAPS